MGCKKFWQAMFPSGRRSRGIRMSVKKMVLTSLFAALFAISSQLYIPIPLSGVPHTIQVLFVLLAGLLLGARWGMCSVFIWILLGTFGLPVFSQGKAGMGVLFGPTGGFLIGFALCAYFVGAFTSKHNSFVKVLFTMLIGLGIVYTVGLLGFMTYYHFFLHKDLPLWTAFGLTVLPFLPFDVIKACVAAGLGIKVRRALYRAGMMV